MGAPAMTNHRVEHARDGQNGDVGATIDRSHWAPMTWAVCITDGCRERVDPWDRNHRCPEHRARPVDLERVRELVDAGRRRGAADAYRRRYPDG